jgi:hypothetical protein
LDHGCTLLFQRLAWARWTVGVWHAGSFSVDGSAWPASIMKQQFACPRPPLIDGTRDHMQARRRCESCTGAANGAVRIAGTIYLLRGRPCAMSLFLALNECSLENCKGAGFPLFNSAAHAQL